MRGLRVLAVVGVSLLVAWGAGCKKSSGGTSNRPPQISQPVGPGTLGGADPDYSTTITVGDSLIFSVTATDPNGANTLTFTATETGGSLTAVQAGFSTTFPAGVTGPSPQTLMFGGTAAAAGNIVLTFLVDDGKAKTDTITYAITISPPPNTDPVVGTPTGPGTIGGADPAYTTTIVVNDSLAFSVTATDADATDSLTFTATVTGGTLTPAQAGFNETFPATASGTSPQSLPFTGTAATAGTLILTFGVDDGLGGTDSITLTININSPPNNVPQITAPTGPGTVGGADPDYTTTINVNNSLDFTVTATDLDATDTLTFTATATGGTITPAQAGFNETFPLVASGTSPQTLTFTGTAAMTGTVAFSIDVADGQGGADLITHTLTINPSANNPPVIGAPTGPGTVGGADPSYTSTTFVSDPLDFTVQATDLDVTDTLTFTATATGGTITPAQAGFNETFPLVASGTSPQTLTFTGTAAMTGTVIFTIDVADGQGGTDLITHTITIGLPPAVLQTADFLDVNDNGLVDAGDTITVTFSQAVNILPTATANTVFTLSGGAGEVFGPACPLVPGSLPTEVVILLTAGSVLQPNGVYPGDPGATGIDVTSAQTDLEGPPGQPVPPLGTPIDVGGTLVPHVVDATYTDVNGDCSVNSGDTIDVTFTTNVNVNLAPDLVFQVLPAAAAPFGTAPSFSGPVTNVSTVTILLDVNPSVVVNGVFDPLNPSVGPSGIDVSGAPGAIVDAAFPSIQAQPYTPPGVDVAGSVQVSVALSTYADDGDGIFGAGDTVQVDFCGVVDVAGTATPASAFQLPITGDTFGTGAVIDPPVPLVGVTSLRIRLGTNPVIQSNGTFDPAVATAGAPSGIDVSTSAEVTETGTATAVLPQAPPGIDIGGSQNIGLWTTVADTMGTARFGHTATLLPNGEILIVGGLHDVASSVNASFREVLDSIEVFDPTTGLFTLSSGTLVAPRAYHKAVRTPGPDDIIDTNDDWVVILGGWSSEHNDSAGGPRSEGSLELIRPDWNGDGDTSDLVVNPDATGSPTGLVIDDLGNATLAVDSACAGVSVPIGFQGIDLQWLPEAAIAGTANNELMAQGGFVTFQWDECNSQLSLFTIWFTGTFSPPDCENGVPYIAIDPNGDGDHADSGIYNLTLTGSPFTTPVALTRAFYTQTRVAGADGIDGNSDDAQIVYGGFGLDTTGVCNSTSPSTCLLADLEYSDWVTWGPVYTGVNDAYTTCGLSCSAAGVGQTDRENHVAVATGNAAAEVVLLGGDHSNAGTQPCTQAVEVITPDFADPTLSTIRYGGLEALANRWYGHTGSALPGTTNVLMAGGVDDDAGGTTASVQYVQVAWDRVDPVADMSEARDAHAAVTIPAGFIGPGNPPEDRVYIFGGLSRTSTHMMVIGDPTGDPGTASNTAEYFTE